MVLPVKVPGVVAKLVLTLKHISNRATPVLFAYTTCFLPRLPANVLSRYVTLPCRLCIVSADKASVRTRLPLTCNATLILVIVVLLIGLLTGTLEGCFRGEMGAGWVVCKCDGGEYT